METLGSLTNIPSLMTGWYIFWNPHKNQLVWNNLAISSDLVWVLGWSQLLIFTLWLFFKRLMSRQPFRKIFFTHPSLGPKMSENPPEGGRWRNKLYFEKVYPFGGKLLFCCFCFEFICESIPFLFLKKYIQVPRSWTEKQKLLNCAVKWRSLIKECETSHNFYGNMFLTVPRNIFMGASVCICASLPFPFYGKNPNWIKQ